MKTYPKARYEQIVIQESGNDLLLYDLTNNKINCLNETSAIIWRNCDGDTSIEAIAGLQKLPIEFVQIAIEDLQKANLLLEKNTYRKSTNSLSRRKMLIRAGLTAASLPLVTTSIAPSAVNAASACLVNGQTFDVPPVGSAPPPDPPETLCVDALGIEAANLCCSGRIISSIFTPDVLCRGVCGEL